MPQIEAWTKGGSPEGDSIYPPIDPGENIKAREAIIALSIIFVLLASLCGLPAWLGYGILPHAMWLLSIVLTALFVAVLVVLIPVVCFQIRPLQRKEDEAVRAFLSARRTSDM